MMRAPTLLVVLGLLLGAGGCGDPPNRLWGSIVSAYGGLPFDTVTIRKIDEVTVQIDYTQGPVNAPVTRAAVVVADVANFVRGQELPALDVRHVAPDGVGFPTLKEGSVTFETDLVVGQTVRGSFHATFVTEAGTERALMGDFEGTLLEAQ